MTIFSVSEFRKLFPILQTAINDHKLVYLDNAATTQKPASVINASQQFYCNSNANVHRGAHQLSARATEKFERVRQQVRGFINANLVEQIIWTKGSTDSINLVAQSYGMNFIDANDEIVISAAEHHANIVPWQHVCQVKGAKLVVLPLDNEGRIDLIQAQDLITHKCKLLAINHISNVLGKLNPIKQLIALAKQQGAITLIDGAQAIAHYRIDVQALDCDFYVFSAHKMYGPTGLGVLYGKKHLLETMPPYQLGGEMIKHVSFKKTTYNHLPFKFEAGTPNIVGVIGFGAAIDLLLSYKSKGMNDYESMLTTYLYEALLAFPNVEFLVDGKPDIGVFSFTLRGVHHQDVASFMDSQGIALRSGHHCAMPLLASFNVEGTVRASLAHYNTKSEIDFFIKQLGQTCTLDDTPSKLSETVINRKPDTELTKNQSTNQIELLALFERANSWDLKHRQIMLLSKQLKRLDKSQRTDESLISGCESKAWLIAKQSHGNQLQFSADSDAKVIRGLMVVILAVYQNKTAQQILNIDIEGYFSDLGLIQHLSPSRGNGVRAIVERIKDIANTSL